MDGSPKIGCSKLSIDEYLFTRNLTTKLVENLHAEDMVVQTEDFVSPTKWHLGHTTWFFEKFLLIPFKKAYKCFSEEFNFIFNSYYNSAGPFHSREKRGFLNRPLFDDVINYRKYVDENLIELFSKIQPDSRMSLLELGINHEQQHQELILMDIKNVFFANPLKPKFYQRKLLESKKISNNIFVLNEPKNTSYGYSGDNFFYDNESPSNKFYLEPFKLNSYITNLEWKEFIEDGGYTSHEYWLSDGWDFIKKNQIKRPLYWIDNNYQFSFHGINKIDDSKPVSHISFYEACAFAKYKKLRLPTEFELEYFLSKSEISGNFLDENNFHEINYCTPSYDKCIYGNLWMWTSSNYVPYKNYKPYKNNLMEYNSKFMCNQFVLKGGSYGTPMKHIRSSYRNFYYPYNRWQFCGVRLVDDIC